MIRKIISTLILLSTLAILGAVISPQLPKTRNLIYYSHCFEPKGYRIGNIDDRFGIDNLQLIKNLEEASSVWNKAYGKNLLYYDPAAQLTINLTYDKRQELNSKIDELDDNLKKQKDEIDPKLDEYNRRSAAFNEKLEAFNSEVRHWNSQGGAPQEEYDKLIKTQENLKNEANALNDLAKELGQTTTKYNNDVELLNQTVNNFGAEISGRPEEGLYEQDGNEETITIYIHNSERELIHTLAHEFGHALRLSHVNNPEAIMHAKTNDVIEPSADDISQLQNVCKERLVSDVIFEHYKNVFNYLRTGKKIEI